MLKIRMEKQYVIIYSIQDYKFHKNFRIINIKTLKNHKKEKISLKQCIKLIMNKEYQIKKIIIILHFKIVMDGL